MPTFLAASLPVPMKTARPHARPRVAMVTLACLLWHKLLLGVQHAGVGLLTVAGGGKLRVPYDP